MKLPTRCRFGGNLRHSIDAVSTAFKFHSQTTDLSTLNEADLLVSGYSVLLHLHCKWSGGSQPAVLALKCRVKASGQNIV